MQTRTVLLYTASLAILYPIPSSNSAICFLPDCQTQADQARSSDSAKDCLMQGYQKAQSANCGNYSSYDYCPSDTSYVKCNQSLWCIENGFDKTECTIPEYLTTQCPNGQPFYQSCTPNFEQACKTENETFTNTCPTGYQLDSSSLCPYSPDWGTCCNLCTGYDYKETTIPSGYVKDASCTACGSIIKYKIKPDPCVGFTTCPNTPKSGTAQCLSGTTLMYKECCAYSCSLVTCPTGASCSLEVCSNRYCINGCLNGYTMSGGTCVPAKPVCVVGDILYSDMSCSSTKVNNKTPIGVVCYVKGTNYLALGLNFSSGYWGSKEDVPGISNYTTKATADRNGRWNTYAWAEYFVEDAPYDYYAGNYCYNYTTVGTKKGDWYLPALGELASCVSTNKTKVNDGLSLLGHYNISSSNMFFSSTEYDAGGAWMSYFSEHKPVDKLSNTSFLCVIDF